jgi:hypothetical protein
LLQEALQELPFPMPSASSRTARGIDVFEAKTVLPASGRCWQVG